MTSIAAPEQIRFGGFGEKLRGLRERAANLLGRLTGRNTVQTSQEVMQYVQPTTAELTSHEALQREYGLPGDYRVDPWASKEQPRAYMVPSETGGPRYETHDEKRVRMDRFNMEHPTANVLETHSFAHTGQLPDSLLDREAVGAYDDVNPYNPSATQPHYPLAAEQVSAHAPFRSEGLVIGAPHPSPAQSPAVPAGGVIGAEYGWRQ